MSLQIGAALRNGFHQLASRTGAILVVAYLVLYGVYQFAFNGLMQALYVSSGFEESATSFRPALDAPTAVTGAIVGVCMLLLTYLTVVAVRTFVAGERESIPGDFLTENVLFAVANLFVGGLVLSVLVGVGFLLLVIPGLFLTVAFLFVTMYVAVENENFVAAMGDSWRLTEGERFSVFKLLLVVLVIGFVFGMLFAVVAVLAAVAGVDSAATTVVNALVVAPLTMYNLAVVSNAFDQLRGDDRGEPDTGTAAGDAPTSPA